MKFKAYAKVNLFLDILYKRKDNYHEVDMILQTISLHDILTIKKSNDGITILCNDSSIPVDEKNIAYMAAKEFFKYNNINGGVHIEIEKNIPKEAGLGGGSSDGATVLKALNQIYETGLSSEQLEDIALKIGSDIPFLIDGGSKRARGRGEILSPLRHMPHCYFLIIKPDINISTGKAYEYFDKDKKNVNTLKILHAFKESNLSDIGKNLYNEFEDYILKKNKEIETVKNELQKFKPVGCLMTGSGSAVYAIFKHKNEAHKAKKELEIKYTQCILCHTQN